MSNRAQRRLQERLQKKQQKSELLQARIEDNFLDQEKFNQLQSIMMGSDFSWYYNDVIDYLGETDKFQFIQFLYRDHCPTQSYQYVFPILEKLDAIAIIRIKANLLTKTQNIIENAFHVDINDISEEILKQWTTSIFYVNTNNGYTKFEDDTVVESIANRLVTFPTNMKHHGTSCTDEKTRVVINFNYFK